MYNVRPWVKRHLIVYAQLSVLRTNLRLVPMHMIVAIDAVLLLRGSQLVISLGHSIQHRCTSYSSSFLALVFPKESDHIIFSHATVWE